MIKHEETHEEDSFSDILGENVDSTNFCPEGVNAERIWISPPSFLYGKDWSLLHRASHMEEIYPICLAQQDSQRAAPQFTSI